MDWPVILKLTPLKLIDMESHVRVESDGIGAVCDMSDGEVKQVVAALTAWLSDSKRRVVAARPCPVCQAPAGADCRSDTAPTAAFAGHGFHYARLAPDEHRYGTHPAADRKLG